LNERTEESGRINPMTLRVTTLTANQIGIATVLDGGNGTDIAFWVFVF
jgi:hypothetical protein